MKKNSIKLSKEQRGHLEKLVRAGESPASKIQHAHILLQADSGPYGPCWSDRQIHEAFGVAESTALRVRRRFQDFGLEHALARSPQPPRPDKRKLNGEQEARLIALLCSSPPDGQEHWSLRLVSKRIVELEIVSSVSHETVRQVLKKPSGQRIRGRVYGRMKERYRSNDDKEADHETRPKLCTCDPTLVSASRA